MPLVALRDMVRVRVLRGGEAARERPKCDCIPLSCGNFTVWHGCLLVGPNQCCLWCTNSNCTTEFEILRSLLDASEFQVGIQLTGIVRLNALVEFLLVLSDVRTLEQHPGTKGAMK
jgi:hypothetical protein